MKKHTLKKSTILTQRAQSIMNGYFGGYMAKMLTLGNFEENGGWEPHLHFQLSLVEPETHDMPGVVAPEDREHALTIYPDPRNVLGPLY